MADTDPEAEWNEWREAKDDYLTRNPHSPIPQDQRDRFDGLDYYPYDPDYRFVLTLDRFDDPQTVTVDTTTEGTQEYLRRGAFTAAFDGESATFHAFVPASDPESDDLWIPLRDATSGDTTYGAGRYLDLSAGDRTDEGWIVDLNYLYSPFCAYNDAYECPLTPVSNWVEVRIEAGERYEE
jgi:hypothetical protein